MRTDNTFYMIVCTWYPPFNVAAPSLKPEIRLRANYPSSEHMGQSDERKTSFGTMQIVCSFQPGERVV